MAYTTVLESVPQKITAGESVSWAVTLSDYPASDAWELTYTLVKSDTKISITSTADGDDHLVEIPYSTTADYDAGEYYYQAHVSNGTERYNVDDGIIEVLPDFATKDTGYDNRDWIDIAIDALEASIQGRASKTQMEQTINNGSTQVQVQHMTLNEQIVALRRLKNMRAGKNVAKKGLRSIRVSF